MPVASALPHWDLTPFFPSVDSTEYRVARSNLIESIDRAETFWNSANVGKATSPQHSEVETALNLLGRIREQATLISAYLECLTTTNSRDEVAAAQLSEFDACIVRIDKLQKQFALWLADFEIETATAKSEILSEHRFFLQQNRTLAQHLMEPRLESLVTDLSTSGSTAWSRLHSNLTSQISVEVNGERMPMTRVRNLAHSADAEVRADAYRAELDAWKENELPLAACLNGIKGEVQTLCRERNWKSPVDQALFYANIDRETLEAMLSAARAAFPVFRRYLAAKARALGKSKLAFYDLFAPIGKSERSWAYEEGCEFVAQNFDAFSQKMGDFARRNFRESWIDAEPREGKVGGAYCTTLRNEESRILMNFDPSFGSVSTLAHELGHGYHSLCLAGQAPLNRETPMTLAETASIFCETVVKNAAIGAASDAEKLPILEASLQGQCQVVVDIFSRYLFEKSVFDQRVHRELSAREFSQLMLDAQLETYGSGLDADLLHPYMWAVKPHYYSTYSFYNFPYMYGLLFGLGLYANYKQDPDTFRKGYDDLLASTGLADAATLGSRFGIDVRSEAFWANSLREIEKDVELFESLV